MQARGFGEGLVFADDAQAREGGDDVDAFFARGLPHVGDERFVDFKGYALLQLPAKHGIGFRFRAWKVVEVLNEDADHRVRQNQRDALVFGAQAGAHRGDSGLESGGIDDVGFDRRGDKSARWKNLDAVTVHTAGPRPTGAGDAGQAYFNGQGRMRGGIEPAGDAAYEIAFVDALMKCSCTIQRKSPY